MGSLEPGHLLLVSVPIIAVAWMSVGGHAPPLGRRAAAGPGHRGDPPAGRLVQPALSAAHHPEVLGVLAVVHAPAVVLALLQGLFRPVAADVVHPYGACGGTDGQTDGFVTTLVVASRDVVAPKRPELRETKNQPPDFYQRADLGFPTSCLFSSEIRGALQGGEGVPYVELLASTQRLYFIRI